MYKAPPPQDMSYYDHCHRRHQEKGCLYACVAVVGASAPAGQYEDGEPLSADPACHSASATTPTYVPRRRSSKLTVRIRLALVQLLEKVHPSERKERPEFKNEASVLEAAREFSVSA
ncbi:hypothetical protein U9M48_029866 [Paspalum notatum var. saurae]|uniref:Uncharacterized protein n=1 Tax=Paspalum notatum var. saurae TaxID=547442 RepID=A0AAQ3X1K3_PASNO